MRFYVSVNGSHTEGHESKDRFLKLVAAFTSALHANGFKADKPVLATIDKPAPETAPLPPEPPVAAPEPVVQQRTLKERIASLRAAAANASLSQAELAEQLGVSRYQIRKALKS